MELRQLEYFIAVATHGSFTRAAREVHTVQSTLSSAINRLEQDVGTALFERTTRRVALTVAGQALLPLAIRMIGDAHAARGAVAAVMGHRKGQVNIGTIQALTWIDLPAALGRFHTDHPGVSITVREAPVDELTDSLLAGDIDLAVVARDHYPKPMGLVTLSSHDEELVVVVSKHHPLADRNEVAIAELAGVPFVNFEAGAGLEAVVSRYCANARIERTIVVHTAQLQLLIELVARGLGAAIIPASLAQHPEIASIPFVAPRPHRTVALLAREQQPSNPAAAALLQYLGV
ncbi:LysR family transcriptional regulator [Leucobacter viscericola]|uniref:LysR family transcriptional regulator n=1 Tax=Leucobacter viscericola TaxID=2714935 RepID=A0A6G7XBT6_9MICO|nr:LysR family transcriptional regulator [Leucobacter viscericola]QIK61962.1 LysR family transcriptional regulator [Leucobacter viscericola]